MKKIELKIVSVSRGQFPNNAFNVLIEELQNKNQFEIIIGYFEANSIGVALEKQASARPMTHDLIVNIIDELKAEVKEVIISHLQEGVFYSQIVITSNSFVYPIDSRTSDAIAIALRAGCPIYTYPEVLKQVLSTKSQQSNKEILSVISQTLEKVMKDAENTIQSTEEDYSEMETDTLENLLERLLQSEDYEKAAKVRDELQKRKD